MRDEAFTLSTLYYTVFSRFDSFRNCNNGDESVYLNTFFSVFLGNFQISIFFNSSALLNGKHIAQAFEKTRKRGLT